LTDLEGLDEVCASHSSRYHFGSVDAAVTAAVDLIKCRRFIWDVIEFILESVDENLITYNCNFPLPDGVALVIDSDDVAVFWRTGGWNSDARYCHGS
jgi:hypothetical protein